MARDFQRGHKARISDLTAGTDLYVGVQIAGPGLTFDISCFGLDADERLSDDRYFIFFNQPKSPEESLQLLGAQAGDTESFRVTLDRIPPHIRKLSFTATVDGAGQMSQIGPGYLRIVAGGEEVARYSFDGAEFSTERAVMLGDFYYKDGWRFAAVGQGFDGGLEALLRNFGGEVLEEQEEAPAAPQGGAGVGAALQKFKETPTGQRWTPQNKKLMRVDLGVGGQPVLAKQGSMVLYQGKVDFGYKGAGFAGRIVGNATGQEMQLMRCSGQGQVFLAENATDLHPVELQGDAICVSAENVLAFDEGLQYEVRRIEGHGIPGGALFTMQFQGTGTIVVKTHGKPVVLPVTPTTFADCNAVVAWSAASQVIVSSQVRMRRNAYLGDTGESVNLQFRGAPGNFIVVQPYEV
ncbi:hypothetical protein FRZ03_14815 [Streptomyces misionensis]|uniref:TerD domain-containing protein n=1 Tax=Streptomyces misionensis TaxID=67331 RepID=A0A5C6JSW3_9ACTN|nr:TerD family protein [Streptomyces misionensis]TWV45902.1 hypothetical protein FRZ03_14815 [Streptomyces misionensis]